MLDSSLAQLLIRIEKMMLAIFLLVSIIALAFLAFFCPITTGHQAFNFTRGALFFGTFAYAGGQACLRVAAVEADQDWMAIHIVAEIVGWIALLIGMKGIFFILVTRSRIESLKRRAEEAKPDRT